MSISRDCRLPAERSRLPQRIQLPAIAKLSRWGLGVRCLSIWLLSFWGLSHGLLSPALVRSDEVVVRRPDLSEQTIEGEILAYDSQGLKIRTSSGGEREFELSDVVAVDGAWPATLFPEVLPDGEELGRLITQLKLAYQREDQRWRKSALLAQASHCYARQQDWSRAVAAFLEIARHDLSTPYWSAAPLVWTAEPLDEPRLKLATGLMPAADQPAAQLIGSSWLLATSPADATRVLERLQEHANPRIQQLAIWQLRRLATRNTVREISGSEAGERRAKVAQWEQEVRQLPLDLRSGPWLVLGRAAQATDDTSIATFAFLQAALVTPQNDELAAEGLYSAARLLAKSNRSAEAQSLAARLLREYPDSSWASAWENRLD